MERIQTTMLRAWALLNGSRERQQVDPPRAGRPRDPGITALPEEAEALAKPGFAEEALPWIDTVNRFALRLTRDRVAAEDLVQETYLRAYRHWEQFDRGTNCKSWLFTICRNTYLHDREKASTRSEILETDLRKSGEDVQSPMARWPTPSGSPDDFFRNIVDDALLTAIDALADDFHQVLVLSDLADLTYPEISQVLGIPIGTVKSRLSRARDQVRKSLLARGKHPQSRIAKELEPR
jgi:RNA polymerase sigma-70 factor (ECF subfamily)